MAIDLKYGRVTFEDPNSIGEDEPVVIFRARDKFLPKVLMYYHLFCLEGGSPKRHLAIILLGLDRIQFWQQSNKTIIPQSKHSPDWSI